MAEVLKVVVRREPDQKAGLSLLDRGVTVEPDTGHEPKDTTKTYGAAGRFLSSGLLEKFGEFFEFSVAKDSNTGAEASEQKFAELVDSLKIAIEARDAERVIQLQQPIRLKTHFVRQRKLIVYQKRRSTSSMPTR